MDTRRDFDAVAAEWDENPSRVKLLGAIAESLVDQLVPTSDMEVLDFGCGTGLMSLHLAPSVKKLTGVDSSAAMLDVMRQKADRLGLTNVETLHVDIDCGDTLPGQYDLVVSSMVFHHIKHIEVVLKKLHGIVKPKGTICIADLDSDGGLFHEDPTGVFHNGFDRDEFRRLMSDAGFCDIRDSLAAEVTKPVVSGGERRFTIFLMCGSKAWRPGSSAPGPI
jgi:2-polyprenyl-3-methyl-5-hydroxy-6-metoxy-1,4-benzoquinol methylase